MKKRTESSFLVSDILISMGYPAEIAELIGSELNTDFTAKQMLGYLKNANPRCLEEVADEMLEILERRRHIIEKHISKKRRVTVSGLYLRSFTVDRNREIEGYVRRIEALRGLESFAFSQQVTLFTGENGSGKSTLLEALAIASGLNPEGGTQNYMFRTYDDHSSLSSAIHLTRGTMRPEWSYFLRAESFFNVASAAGREYNLPHDYHAQSHGESFIDFVTDKPLPGLYFLDEPEAALSPQKQLELLLYIYKMAGKGSQFVIATHSPILLGIPGADIVSFDDGALQHISYEETQSYRIMRLFINNRESMLRHLLQEDGE